MPTNRLNVLTGMDLRNFIKKGALPLNQMEEGLLSRCLQRGGYCAIDQWEGQLI